MFTMTIQYAQMLYDKHEHTTECNADRRTVNVYPHYTALFSIATYEYDGKRSHEQEYM